MNNHAFENEKLTETTFKMTCDLEALQARAELYQRIRTFFAERNVLEVETPLLSQAGTTDVHLASVQALRNVNGVKASHYLHTSPEFAMKRLLASGSGAIYQICKVFRDDEHGRKHNSEFTMLEWYRPDFDLKDLMYETTDLLNSFGLPLFSITFTLILSLERDLTLRSKLYFSFV